MDSLPEAKYVLFCKLGKSEIETTFYILRRKLQVKKAHLVAIFPNTDDKRIDEVLIALNDNSLLFGLNTPERMAHFIGQIGAETGGLEKLKEEFNYTGKNIFDTFLKLNLRSNSNSATGKTFRYCDLIEGYDCPSLNGCVGTNQGQSDCNKAIPVKLKNSVCSWDYVAFDSTYNIKASYISSLTLFDYVYGCRMDNGAKSTKDGSTYLGKGFIHITGKSGYKAISVEWNKLYPSDKKEFHGKDINLLDTDISVAIKASMVYWKLKNLNNLADKGTDDKSINDVGERVNGTNPPNGELSRKLYTKSALKNIE